MIYVAFSVIMSVQLRTATILGIMTLVFGWRPFVVKYINESYEIIHPEMFTANLSIRNGTFLDVHANVLRDIHQGFVDIEVVKDSGDGIYDMVYMNRTVDVCMFLNDRKSNVFFDIAYKILSDYGDLPKKCPIRKKRYELLNVYVDPEKYPPFMPNYKARFTCVAWNRNHGKKNVLAKLRVDVVIERSFKSNNGK